MGKERDKIATNLGATVVKKHVEPIHNTSQNIACDELFERLKVKLTFVGTVMPNGKHLTIALTAKWNHQINYTFFAFKDHVTVCSWVPKKESASFVNPSSNQWNCTKWYYEITEFYNQTKAGVDALDQKVRHYSTYQKTKRWHQAVFYNILHITAYNAFFLSKLRPPAQGFNFKQR